MIRNDLLEILLSFLQTVLPDAFYCKNFSASVSYIKFMGKTRPLGVEAGENILIFITNTPEIIFRSKRSVIVKNSNS